MTGGPGQVLNFKKPESVPVRVSCDIHAHESAYWLVTDHPYAAVSDSDGDFKIRKLAYGEYDFRVWHEAVGYLNAGMKIKVDADNIELAPIMMQESMFYDSRAKAKPANPLAPMPGSVK